MKNLKDIVLFLFVVGCLNKSNAENPELLNTKEGRKTELDTVYISKDSLVKLYYLKSEYNEIVTERDEFFSDVFISPDLTYKKCSKEDSFFKFSSEFGGDTYYQLYAYFLKKKYDSQNYEIERNKLIDLYYSINKAFAIIARGGSFFAHNIPRIHAYAEWDIYSHYVLNSQNKNNPVNSFMENKLAYININNQILKLDKFQNNTELKSLFSFIYQNVESEFYLQRVIKFQEKFDHILKL